MKLWIYWWNIVILLRPAFSRLKTFMWFATCIAGFSTRCDLLGVSSMIRSLGLDSCYYNNLLNCFHSTGVQLDKLNKLWVRVVLKIFPNPIKINGRLILVGDGIKIPKQGKKMPAVKSLHQESESNTKAEYIMGHSFQAVSILMQADLGVLAVPLAMRIHEGIVTTNRDRRTLLDKMITLLNMLGISSPYYFVADAYYANKKTVAGLLKNGNHLITRAKSNAVAYEKPLESERKQFGRKRIYGKKIKLKSLLKENQAFEIIDSPIYGEKNVNIQCQVHDLLWRPVGAIVRFVIVIHPTRGRCILMSTDLSLSATEIIHLYGLRFKIEHTFKQSVRVVGVFSYHFWMKAMKPIKRRSGDQYIHKESKEYRKAVHRKIKAYHVFVLAGMISQGLLQYLAAVHPKQVWKEFGSWLRTIRPGVAPSEFVVAIALRQSFPEFLLVNSKNNSLAKFIVDRQDLDRSILYRSAA